MIGGGIWFSLALHYGGERKYVKCAVCGALALFCFFAEFWLTWSASR